MYAAILYITKYWIHLLPFISIFHMRDGLVYSILYRWAFRFCEGGLRRDKQAIYRVISYLRSLQSYYSDEFCLYSKAGRSDVKKSRNRMDSGMNYSF